MHQLQHKTQSSAAIEYQRKADTDSYFASINTIVDDKLCLEVQIIIAKP